MAQESGFFREREIKYKLKFVEEFSRYSSRQEKEKAKPFFKKKPSFRPIHNISHRVLMCSPVKNFTNHNLKNELKTNTPSLSYNTLRFEI